MFYRNRSTVLIPGFYSSLSRDSERDAYSTVSRINSFTHEPLLVVRYTACSALFVLVSPFCQINRDFFVLLFQFTVIFGQSLVYRFYSLEFGIKSPLNRHHWFSVVFLFLPTRKIVLTKGGLCSFPMIPSSNFSRFFV